MTRRKPKKATVSSAHKQASSNLRQVLDGEGVDHREVLMQVMQKSTAALQRRSSVMGTSGSAPMVSQNLMNLRWWLPAVGLAGAQAQVQRAEYAHSPCQRRVSRSSSGSASWQLQTSRTTKAER